MKARNLTLVLAGLAMLGPFATDTFLPSFPAISTHFDVSSVLVQQTLSVYLAAYAFMTLFYGTLSDSFGRRPVILASLVIFAVGSIGAVFAPSFGWLLFFRGMQGASAGAGRVIGQAIVRDSLQGAAAQKMLANIMMLFGIAPAIAPIIGGWLHVAYGWQSTFVFTFAITVLLLLACLKGLPETLPAAQRQPFHPGTIAVNYWQALRHRTFLLLSLAVAFAFGGFALYIASAANFILELLRLPETAFGWLFIPQVAGIVAGSALNSRLAHTVPSTTMVRWGMLAMATTSALNIAYNHWFSASIPWAIVPVMLYTFGMSLALPGMTMATLDIFPQMRGLAASLQNFVQMLLFALVSGFIAPLLFDSAFKLALGQASAVVLAGLFWWLGTRQRAPAPLAQGAKMG
ncbi:multidrug effflux MFS transporter [Janthinobacterium sp. HLX7-2]|uniref:multidrug effflux MFS transporter n=1 Tax=Janthinobacterium sp. HLX7-2 TaxID=1259331 RepID=UPI003F1F2B46